MQADTLTDSALETLRQTVGDDPNFSETIVPDSAEDFMHAWSPGTEDAHAPRVELVSIIGEGGMAQVHLAWQRTLARHVAVKMLRPDQQGEKVAHRLLQEAWTTGALEHPNIIPIHDITVAKDGSPQIVLKRVQGRNWSDLLNVDSPAPLQEQLRVLMDVARAVEFAHLRGFLHRDLKPENVLVGEAGDVYLVDWGIAVATRRDVGEHFALASDVRSVAGTPAYMAPEMLDPASTPLGPWTDIYLLGSILYELLTGRAPHDAETLAELVLAITRGPVFPREQPELVRICERAMRSDPNARFESALHFRLAIEGYLRHEGARAIAAKADDAFRRWLDDRLDGDGVAADTALAESRFGYQAALEAWPEYEHAATRLRALDLETAQLELDAGNLESARRIVGRIEHPPESLLAHMRMAEEEHRESEQRRDSLDAEVDEATHRGTRAAVSAFFALSWVTGPLFRAELARATPLGVVGPYLGALLFVLAIAVVVRHAIWRSYINRALAAVALGVTVSDLTLALIAHRYELGPLWLFQTLPIAWAPLAVTVFMVVSRCFWPTVIAMAALCFLVREAPGWVDEWTCAATLIVFFNAAWVNRGWSELRQRFGQLEDARSQ